MGEGSKRPLRNRAGGVIMGRLTRERDRQTDLSLCTEPLECERELGELEARFPEPRVRA
jgi:hypothetical protein